MSAREQGYQQFNAAKGPEWMLRIGDPRTPPILFVPPLFEELNRTRALMVAIMRRAAAEGHGCWLPDLAGTNESQMRLDEVSWGDWRADVAAAAAFVEEASGMRVGVATLRGGCLIDDAVSGRCWWRAAPVAGAGLARDMDRAGLAGGAEWAGYPAAAELREALRAAVPAPVRPVRTVRLETDAAEADAKVIGPALWRRSEPGQSAELAAALADDLVTWSRACAAS